MQGNSREAGVVVLHLGHRLRWSEGPAEEFQEQPVLEHGIVAKVVVGGVLIRLVVVDSVTHEVAREAGAYPGEEIVVRDVFMGHVVVQIMIVRHLIIQVLGITANLLVVSVTSCPESSHRRSQQSL